MLRLNTQDPTFVTLRTAAIALLLINCSATGEPVAGHGGSSNGNGGSSNSSGGTNSSSGGSSNGSGGATQGSGGSSTSMGGSSTSMGGAAAKGGSTSSGGATTGSGGATTGSGGATTGSGGATTGSGGATTGTGGATSTCTAYAGTTAKDSLIFKDGFGTAKTGTWSGYTFTYTYGKATIVPAPMTSCFKGAQLCVSGSIPADDGSGAGLGWNIGQASGSMTNTPVALTGSIKFTVAGAPAGSRVSISTAADVEYCYSLSATEISGLATGVSVPVTSFKTECWDTAKAVAYSNAPIAKIQVAVPGAMAGAKSFDLCVIDIEPG